MKNILKNIIGTILQLEARLVLKRYKPKIIAVVGSVGKTSTKDAIFAVLRSSHFVRKSEKSFNSDIGVPLTILGLNNAWSNPFRWLQNIVEGILVALVPRRYPEWLVLEVGADRPGDIKSLASWVEPTILVYTRLPSVPVHVEYFDSPEAVVEEKLSMLKALLPESVLILNGDDERIRSVLEQVPGHAHLSYGFEKNNNLLASHYQIIQQDYRPTGIRFRINREGSSIPVSISGALGRQHVYPALVALAVGSVLKLNLLEIAQTLNGTHTPSGRMRVLPGIKNTVIIDDSYNSSPIALEEALSTLEQIKVRGKKIAVLGDMLELGKYSVEEHRRAGAQVKEICDLLVTVGPRARDIARGALEMGMSESNIFQYDDPRRAGKELEYMLKEGDIVLVKGSQGIRTEHVVEEIMHDPLRKEELLVRQDREWVRR